MSDKFGFKVDGELIFYLWICFLQSKLLITVDFDIKY